MTESTSRGKSPMGGFAEQDPVFAMREREASALDGQSSVPPALPTALPPAPSELAYRAQVFKRVALIGAVAAVCGAVALVVLWLANVAFWPVGQWAALVTSAALGCTLPALVMLPWARFLRWMRGEDLKSTSEGGSGATQSRVLSIDALVNAAERERRACTAGGISFIVVAGVVALMAVGVMSAAVAIGMTGATHSTNLLQWLESAGILVLLLGFWFGVLVDLEVIVVIVTRAQFRRGRVLAEFVARYATTSPTDRGGTVA